MGRWREGREAGEEGEGGLSEGGHVVVVGCIMMLA